MNKKVFVLIFLSIFSIAFIFPVRSYCDDNPEKGSGTYVKKKSENGILIEEGWLLDEGKTGFWKFYHENGKLKNEGNYQKGKLQDWWKEYDDDENLIIEGCFSNDEKEAHWKFYYASGKLMKEGIFVNDKKQGWWKEYSDTGDLLSVGQYEAGQREGFWRMFYLNGSIRTEGHYTEDVKFDWWKEYDSAGKLYAEGYYYNDLRDGFWIHYENEVRDCCGMYEKGARKYAWKFFNEKGELSQVYEF